MRIHHIGIVVADIKDFVRKSFWKVRTEIVEDPLQKARLCLVGVPGDPLSVELIQPISHTSPTWEVLQQGGGLRHLCFAVQKKNAADEQIVLHRMIPVTQWLPAKLFEGKSVRFAYTRNRELVEFVVESPK